MNKKVALIITDGIGFNNSCKFNAFCHATKPTYDNLFKTTPYNYIKTSGLAVGLPKGQMGNSEVGHMTIGAGRIIYQNLVKINKSIENNKLKENLDLQQLLSTSNKIHIVGLLSDGGVHSHINHLIEMAKIAETYNKIIKLHLITDGRDVDPKSAIDFVNRIEKEVVNDYISIATISGRFWTMDRDNRWERVQKGYNSIVNSDRLTEKEPMEFIQESYENGIFDEFLTPTSFNNYSGAEYEDGFIFINFRNDRMREFVYALGDEKFDKFPTKNLDFNIITMTEYDSSFPYPIIFPKITPKNTLAEVVSNAGLRQLHTAETEKYAHVTFFLNGGIEEPLLNESRVLIPSPKVNTYDLQPEMSAKEVGNSITTAMKNGYDLIVANFANGDMVGHTGVFEAGIKAVETVDRELGKIFEMAKKKDYSVILTSDHGNCEEMQKNGKTLTNHTTYDVFCFISSNEVKKVKKGGLNNIAPTVLKLMGLEIPKEMDKPLI